MITPEKKIQPKEIKKGMKTRRIIIGSTLGVIILAFILFSDHGLIKRFKLEIERRNISSKIEKEKKERDSLNQVMGQLKFNMFEIERIAREHYGMIKPSEKIYIIKEVNNK
jgi:cell division protein FtsB